MPQMPSENPRPTFRVEPFAVVRVPLLPLNTFFEWESAVRCGDGDDWLRRLIARPEIRAAIHIASPSLARALSVEMGSFANAAGTRTKRAVVRYVLRMIGRCTPFGLFAGTDLGIIGDRTTLTVAGSNAFGVLARLDAGVLCGALERIACEPGTRATARLVVNPTLYRCGHEYRFIEQANTDGALTFAQASAEADDALCTTIASARGGSTKKGLIDALTAQGHEAADAFAFIDTLLDEQILTASFGMPIVSDNPLAATLAEATCLEMKHPFIDALGLIESELHAASTGSMLDCVARLDTASQYAFNAGLCKADDICCDVQLRVVADVQFGPNVIAEIERAANALVHFQCGAPGSPLSDLAYELDAFRERFEARFGEAVVPILAALDSDLGVGFRGANAAAPHDVRTDRTDSKNIAWRLRLTELIQDAARGRMVEIVLKDEDIDTVARVPRAPRSALMFVRAAFRDGASDLELLVGKFAGPTSTMVLGRFATEHKPLFDHIRQAQCLDWPAESGMIDAEVVFWPGGRMGNITARPRFYDFDINVMGRGSAPNERSITCDDLAVTVFDGRVILYSVQHRAIVRPHMTCAHAAAHPGLPSIYRFLYALVIQGVDLALMWDWGELDSLAFLPRVRYGPTIMALARWRLKRADLRALASNDIALNAAVRCRLELPRFVTYMEYHEERMVVDLENPVVVDAFLAMTRGAEEITVAETFPDPTRSAMTRGSERFMHDILVPLRNEVFRESRQPPPLHGDSFSTRIGLPGGNWLYLRITAGVLAAETILLDIIGPMARELEVSGYVDRWYFVRYGDPHHLRVRFHGEPETLQKFVLPRLLVACNNYASAGVIAKLEIDTYQPEVRRYGGLRALDHAESIFFADSVAVAAALSLARMKGLGRDPDHRMVLACQSVHFLLQALIKDESERTATIHTMAESFLREQAPSEESAVRRRRELAGAFRAQRRALDDAILTPNTSAVWAAFAEIFVERSSRIAPEVAALGALADSGALTCEYQGIVHSLLHMNLNRLFMDEHRRHEQVAYDFTRQLYRSSIARLHNDSKVGSTA